MDIAFRSDGPTLLCTATDSGTMVRPLMKVQIRYLWEVEPSCRDAGNCRNLYSGVRANVT